jgi:hypothetical protein
MKNTITDAIKADCLTKLSLMKYFPSEAGALKELGRMLDELCQSDQEAIGLTDAILKEHDEWCGPYTLRQTAEARQSRTASDGLPPGCGKCLPWGQNGWAWTAGPGSAMCRCTCALGTYLRDLARAGKK